MTKERRSAERLRTNINVRWETLKTEGHGSVCDLSASGCFVLGGGQIIQGELIQMCLILEDKIVTVWGQVIYAINEMGFAVRFVCGAGDQERIHALLSKLY